jgi:hypothetical protein
MSTPTTVHAAALNDILNCEEDVLAMQAEYDCRRRAQVVKVHLLFLTPCIALVLVYYIEDVIS